MMKFYLLPLTALLVVSCGVFHSYAPYNENWSKAKNIVHSAGMNQQVFDQQLPTGAYNKDGTLKSDKLNKIAHPAYGSASGIQGVTVQPYGAFERFYWGWSVPGVSHYDENRVFAWMPADMANSEAEAREKMELMLGRASLAILEEMGFRHQVVQKPFQLGAHTFQQWYLDHPERACRFARLNCMLSLYVPTPEHVHRAPKFAYYSIAGEPAWFFASEDTDDFPRLTLAQSGGLESMRESVFFQKLSARLPGWVYFYLAPDEVGTGENNTTIAYPYVLEKGKPLLFIRPTL